MYLVTRVSTDPVIAPPRPEIVHPDTDKVTSPHREKNRHWPDILHFSTRPCHVTCDGVTWQFRKRSRDSRGRVSGDIVFLVELWHIRLVFWTVDEGCELGTVLSPTCCTNPYTPVLLSDHVTRCEVTWPAVWPVRMYTSHVRSNDMIQVADDYTIEYIADCPS